MALRLKQIAALLPDYDAVDCDEDYDHQGQQQRGQLLVAKERFGLKLALVKVKGHKQDDGVPAAYMFMAHEGPEFDKLTRELMRQSTS